MRASVRIKARKKREQSGLVMNGQRREIGRKIGKPVTVAKRDRTFQERAVINKTQGCREIKPKKGLRISHGYRNRAIFNCPRKISFSQGEGK